VVFSSHIFLFYFLPAALLAYYVVPDRRRLLVLTFASYLFYSWTNPWFLLVLGWTTCVDFCCGNLIYGHWRLRRSRRFSARNAFGPASVPRFQRRMFVAVSVANNLGMLAFFKYFVFAEQNLNAALSAFGETGFSILHVALPAGISFYTFESISYGVDIYSGRARPASAWVFEAAAREGRLPQNLWGRLRLELRALSGFACYITQFPHLVAGPIIRYQDLERQIHSRTYTIEKFARGVAFLSLGMAKKVLLANPMGDVADAAFGAGVLPWYDAWYGVAAYAFQLYFDFSGYSDMAIGLALMLGFVFPKNFDAPYRADSITDFWRRWHISLSTWLRDYLYVPLGGNRQGRARTYLNLLVVMLLGGFWHGAQWTFVLWGAFHGVLLALERMQGRRGFYWRLPRAARVAFTFLLVCVGWVFFRAESVEQSVVYTLSLFGLATIDPGARLIEGLAYAPYHVTVFALSAAIVWGGVQTWDYTRRLTPARACLCLAALVLSVLMMWTQTVNPFLYFQF
jgi:alginate O-acetyltransferase complex protein AlgI